jgi:eukaryotic translation initiation factor 2-alpha kinase 4
MYQNYSRYKEDFKELSKIGEGGAGRVFCARHKVDGGIYAIKKVRLYQNDSAENERIIREVQVLFRLHNEHIVRYYQSWREFISDPKEIKDLEFSDEEDPFDRVPQSQDLK